MTSKLRQWLAQPDSTLCWIEFEAYARRVFSNDPADWHQDAARYTAGLMQAQSIIGSACLAVDLVRPFLARHPGASAPEIVAALTDTQALRFVDQALSAFTHRFAERLDIVLKVSAPFDLLRAEQASVTFDDLDEVATALTALVRRFADRPLAGLMIDKDDPALNDDELDAYQPLLGVARHYGWVTALALPGVTELCEPPALDLDILLLPRLGIRAVAAGNAAKVRIGGGLNDVFWNGGGFDAEYAPGQLLYGEVPREAMPETVVALLGKLKSAS